MSPISAVAARGHMRFMIKKKGGVNADVFIEFLKRLTVGATRPIFLIVDRGPAHRAKTTKAFVETLDGKLQLFFLPPYSPDRNPDELVCSATPGKSAPSSKRTRSNTPPGCLYTSVLINNDRGAPAQRFGNYVERRARLVRFLLGSVP